MKYLSLGAALALGTLAMVASAQGVSNGDRFGAWHVTCEATGVNRTICGLNQRILRSSDGRYLADVLALWTPDLSQRYLLARVPLGVFFPSGLSLGERDAAARLQFTWQACGTQLCEAVLVLDDETLAAIEGSETPQLLAYRPGAGQEPLVFELQTAGLGEGLDTLKASLTQE